MTEYTDAYLGEASLPGGIGPISGDTEKNLSRGVRRTGLDDGATPVQIFYNLGIGRVHYLPEQRILYFVESVNTPVMPTIRKACEGLSSQPECEQLYLDQHGFIQGPVRVVLNEQQASVVLVALRLTGTRVDLAEFCDSPEAPDRV